MALMSCPECGEKISDKAEKCIHCGFPISSLADTENIVGENITAETPNTIDDSEPSKQSGNITAEPKKKNMGCGITIIILIIVVILIAWLFGGEDHDDGKCDICGKSGAIQVSDNAELCTEHILKANNQYYKNNGNYGGF